MSSTALENNAFRASVSMEQGNAVGHISKKETVPSRPSIEAIADEMANIQDDILKLTVSSGIPPQGVIFVINLNTFSFELAQIRRGMEGMRRMMEILGKIKGIHVYGGNTTTNLLLRLFSGMYSEKVRAFSTEDEAFESIK